MATHKNANIGTNKPRLGGQVLLTFKLMCVKVNGVQQRTHGLMVLQPTQDNAQEQDCTKGGGRGGANLQLALQVKLTNYKPIP